MAQFFRNVAATIGLFVLVTLASAGGAFAQGEPEVRVIVPDVPGGAIISGCYNAVGRIYGAYRFEFCLKQRGSYAVRGGGVRCDGRLTWSVAGLNANAKLRRTSCGNGVAWSADSFNCRPSLLLGIIATLLKEDKPLLRNLVCDYTPARGSGQQPISFVAVRQ